MRQVVCQQGEIAPGTTRGATIGRTDVVIVRTNSGSLHAFHGYCPHQGGPLSAGCLRGTTLPSDPGVYRYGREGEILRCPWHGFEFDVLSGRCVADGERLGLRAFAVATEGDDVVVEV